MLQRVQNYIVNLSGGLAALLLIPMTLIAIVQVASRYLMHNPITFTEELLRFLLIWSAMFGAVYCFGTKRHLALSFLSEMVYSKVKTILSILINLLSCFFSVTILIIGGLRVVGATTQQLSATMRIPMSTIYSILPITGILILLIIGIDIIKQISSLKQGDNQ